MEEPLISVNITTFNRGDLLTRCLNSVLAQKYENLEIIIVDDASVDNTRDILEKYSSNDDRIKYYVHNKNKGNAAARNTAFKNSKGKYIAFLDDDDEWIDCNKLKKQVEVLEADTCGSLALVCSNVIVKTNNKDRKIFVSKRIKPHERIATDNGIIFSPTVLTRRSCLEKTNGFDEKLFRGVDADYYRNLICILGYQFYILPDFTTIVYNENRHHLGALTDENTIYKSLLSYEYLINKYESLIKTKKSYQKYWLNILIQHYLDIYLIEKKKIYIKRTLKILSLMIRNGLFSFRVILIMLKRFLRVLTT